MISKNPKVGITEKRSSNMASSFLKFSFDSFSGIWFKNGVKKQRKK
jgi:hypothetical protein